LVVVADRHALGIRQRLLELGRQFILPHVLFPWFVDLVSVVPKLGMRQRFFKMRNRRTNRQTLARRKKAWHIILGRHFARLKEVPHDQVFELPPQGPALLLLKQAMGYGRS
jgi:hypothetical protein